MKHDDLKLDQYRFTVRLMTAEEGTGYLIEFPDVPLCMSDGATVEEAIVNGWDALKCCLLTMKEFGDPIPKPGSSGGASGQFRLRIPKTVHARLTNRAEQEGVSLNTLVTAMIAEGSASGRQADPPPACNSEEQIRPKTPAKVRSHRSLTSFST
jgi:antitoxin HicB